jgi:Acetokinase family
VLDVQDPEKLPTCSVPIPVFFTAHAENEMKIDGLTTADVLQALCGVGSPRWSHRLEHLGINLDRARNDANADTISVGDSRCLVRVIPTNEDLMIARHTYELLFSSRQRGAHA